MTPWTNYRTDYGSLREFGRFALAREFVNQADSADFAYQKNRLERLGDAMLTPFFSPTDHFFRNIRNPLVILSMTVTAIALVTIGFYPAQFLAGVHTAFPFMRFVKPAQAKFTLYLATQTVILGLGLRTLGRQNNGELMAAFRSRSIKSIPLGSFKTSLS